ncbi:MAG: hypothetical protein FWC28_03080, partial [Proteobacteria bacterium]|nr:hypothetical protein [Pseudomonadota bacterium]
MQRGYVVLVAAALWTATLGGCDSPKKTELPRILEEVKKLEDKVARAREGQSVDFDGDGFAEYTQSVAANGIRRVEIKNQDDKVRSTFTIWPDGSLLHTFSEYADGIVDFQEERTHGKTLKTYDTNRDGNFDRRVTFLPSDSPLFIRVIQEQLNNKNEWLSEESLQPTTLEWSTLPSPATQLLSYTPP